MISITSPENGPCINSNNMSSVGMSRHSELIMRKCLRVVKDWMREYSLASFQTGTFSCRHCLVQGRESGREGLFSHFLMIVNDGTLL